MEIELLLKLADFSRNIWTFYFLFFFFGHFTFSFYLCKVILNKSFSIPKTNTKFYVSYISTRKKKKITTGVSYVWWLICRHSLVLRTKRRKECPSSASCQDPQIFRKMMVVKPKERLVKGRSERDRLTQCGRHALNLWPEDPLWEGGWGEGI